MKEKLWKEYRQWKEIGLEGCKEKKEKVEGSKDDAVLRKAIKHVEDSKQQLYGMINMMWGLGAITEEECKEERKKLRKLFSAEHMFCAYVKTETGELKRLEKEKRD